MQTFGISKRLLSLGLLCAGIGGAAGCSGDYGLFDVHPHFAADVTLNDRVPVDKCVLYITDEKNEPVVSGYRLVPQQTGDSSFVGCPSGQTPSDLGHLSYSTSRSSGSLSFRVDALDSNGNPVATGTSQQWPVKTFHNTNDIVMAEVVIEKH